MSLAWTRLCSRAELSLSSTLRNGQCFSWRALPSGVFAGIVGGHLVQLRHAGDAPDAAVEAFAPAGALPALRDYFQLDTPLAPLVAAWSAADARVAAIAAVLPGMRVLRQDPWQCLISFICSSNNNIARITLMLDRLSASHGELVGELEGVTFYRFPTPDQVVVAGEERLRALGFGYRARYVARTAEAVVRLGGDAYLRGLRGQPRAQVQSAVLAFDGCGRKVADCVALFSLDTPGAVPVDTHVWAIARCYYGADAAGGAAASLTPAHYDRVGDTFRSLFGDHAGWAHCLLFAAELPAIAAALPAGLGAEMTAFRAREKVDKAAGRVAARARKAARAATAAAAAAAAAAATGAAGAATTGEIGVAATPVRSAAAAAAPAALAAAAAATPTVKGGERLGSRGAAAAVAAERDSTGAAVPASRTAGATVAAEPPQPTGKRRRSPI